MSILWVVFDYQNQKTIVFVNTTKLFCTRTGNRLCLRKESVSLVMSDCRLIVRTHGTIGSHPTDFHETWYSSIFRNSAKKIHVWLKHDKNKGHFTSWPVCIYDIWILIGMRIFETKSGHVWQHNTANALFMLDNEGYKHTLRIYNSYCFSMAAVVARTRLIVSLTFWRPNYFFNFSTSCT